MALVISTVDTIIRDVCKELKAVETRVISSYPQLSDVSISYLVQSLTNVAFVQ